MKKKCWCEFSSVIKKSIELSSMFLSPSANIKDSHVIGPIHGTHESHTTLIMAVQFLYILFKS